MAKEVPQLVKASLRAVLLSSQKGIKQTSIEKDYHKLTNSRLDVRKYGFEDLYEFLLAVPDVARLEYSAKDGENKVFGVAEKGVYMSDHAKKAVGIPTGLKPLPPSEWPRNKASKERTVVETKSSLKVTVDSDSKRKIVPNSSGLYALYVKNLPPNCQQNDISRIFKKFQSLKEVKVEGSSSNRVAFVRFSSYTDADRAISDMDGYNLQGFSLIINPAVERNAKVGKDVKEQSKVDSAKKKDNSVAAKSAVDNKEVSPGRGQKNMSPPKFPMQTVVSGENWETDSGLLSPKSEAGTNNMFFSQENLAACLTKVNGSYPIHVSNFPRGTAQSTLKQIFSGCGDIVRVESFEKHAFIYFTRKEGALTALQTMQKKVNLEGKILTVTPRTLKNKASQQHTSSLPGSASALSRGSSQSSISSGDSSLPQSPVNHGITEAGFGLGDSSHDSTPTGTAHSEKTVSKNKKWDETSVKEKPATNNIGLHQEERKLDRQKLNMCVKAPTKDGGCSTSNTDPPVSDNLKQSIPVHTLLSYEEMCELMKRCNKPMKTATSIAFEEFDVLVTDVVDSCCFWANIDDQSGSYMKLQQIRTDLQIVEHHRQGIPAKHQLGAAKFSEDNKWYRCWCLEVSSQEKQAKVFYIDFGNCEWIPWDQFTDIHKGFWDLAPQAVAFKLAGIEHAPKLTPDILNEGSKYLSDLICNKVCRARKMRQSDSNKAHVIEVELVLKDESNTSVNEQMALTRYVQETRTATQGVAQNPPVREINPSPSHLISATNPRQPEHHIPPHPFMKARHSTAQVALQSVSNEPLPQKQSEPLQLESIQAQSTQSSFPSPQGRQGGFDQQTLQNAKLDPIQKLHQGTYQQQRLLPNQLFERKDTIEVFLSNVVTPEEIDLFLADERTKETLQKIHYQLKTFVDPKAANCKIYPKIGDVVVKIVDQKKFRVRIISLPTSTAYGMAKVKVKSIDYGRVEMVPLSALCELPQVLKNIPPQAKEAKLAGIQKKQGMSCYPDAAISRMVNAKSKKQVMQASVIKREQDGLLHVELFESSAFPSLNVELVKLGYADVDPSQCSFSGSERLSPRADDNKSPETQTTSNLPPTEWHQPGMTERRQDVHQCDNHSIHSDWEENLIETYDEDWNDVTPVTESHRQSWDQLYVPPPPNVRPPSETGSVNSIHSDERLSFPAGLTSRAYPDITHSLLAVQTSGSSPDIVPPYLASSINSPNLDMHPCYTAQPETHAPSEVRPPSPSTTGSDSSGVYSDTSLNSLSSAETISEGDKSLQDSIAVVSQQTLELSSADQDWKQERDELIQNDNELKRILDMPRQEMKRMISLRQEKERLERQIRIKEMENQILKLQKELKQLESEKEMLKEKQNNQ